MNKYPLSFTLPITLKISENLVATLFFSKKNLKELANDKANYLHAKEYDYFKLLKNQKRQTSYLLGRYCAKKALSSHTKDKNLSSWEIKNGIFEQPIIKAPFMNKQIDISIAHSSVFGLALVFSSSYPMGIDLEIIDPIKINPILRYCTADEKKYISTQNDDATLIFLFWTVKEALSKVLRTGLMTSFKLYEVNKIKKYPNYYKSTFRHFPQYICISWQLGKILFSVVLPKNIDIDLSKIINKTYLSI